MQTTYNADKRTVVSTCLGKGFGRGHGGRGRLNAVCGRRSEKCRGVCLWRQTEPGNAQRQPAQAAVAAGLWVLQRRVLMLLTGWARLAGRSSSGYKCLEDAYGADNKTRGQPLPTPTHPLARQAQPVAAIGEASRAHFGPSLAQQGRKTSS